MRWLDRLNMYGINPARLIIKIIRKRVLKAGENPLILEPRVRET